MRSLSPRESQVARLYSIGYTNSEIAKKLSISIGMVKAHSNSAYKKLGLGGAGSRIKMINLLYREGICEVDDLSPKAFVLQRVREQLSHLSLEDLKILKSLMKLGQLSTLLKIGLEVSMTSSDFGTGLNSLFGISQEKNLEGTCC